ncbi:MAG: hypothetical protein KME12_06570 [Trichocoleus desertorum ATA4-8-CV12]|jgi:hypothetical protein|nr:hypothetical protein [Trichocoleus desertorum ATA4-8-CV12]
MNQRFLSALLEQRQINLSAKQPHQLRSSDRNASAPSQQTSSIKTKLTALGLTTLLGVGSSLSWAELTAKPAQAAPIASVGRAVAFTCSDSQATIKAKGGPSVTFGTTSIYIGYQQVSSLNKNPRLVRFDNGQRTWCKTDYEVTNDDGTGYGLIWDGGSVLYGVFSSTGTQGLASQDFRRFATNSWLPTYGQGGGSKIAVLARINPSTGTIANATFLSAQLTSGASNSVAVTGLSWTGSSLVVKVNSWFSPRRTNKTRMTCSGSSPFVQTITFAANLGSALKSTADRCQ